MTILAFEYFLRYPEDLVDIRDFHDDIISKV